MQPYDRLPCLLIAILLTASLLTACSGGGSDPEPDMGSEGSDIDNTPSTPTETPSNNGMGGELEPSEAQYRITFNSSWSADTHPDGFPGNPHFSGLVGAVHNEQVVFWQPGDLASDGIERMAESGARSGVASEASTAVDQGTALAVISAGGIGLSPGSVSVEVTVSTQFPLITVTSMLAPSPDWFVGVHGLSVLQDGQFTNRQTVPLRLYDAGTDSGPSYTSGNDDTDPPDPIALLSSQAGDSPFRNGLPVVGELIVERIEIAN